MSEQQCCFAEQNGEDKTRYYPRYVLFFNYRQRCFKKFKVIAKTLT
jgi:hypothetical protein